MNPPKKVRSKSTRSSKKFSSKKVPAHKKQQQPASSSSGQSGPSSEDSENDDRSRLSKVEVGKIVEVASPVKKRTHISNYDDKEIEVLLKLCFKNYNIIDGNISFLFFLYLVDNDIFISEDLHCSCGTILI